MPRVLHKNQWFGLSRAKIIYETFDAKKSPLVREFKNVGGTVYSQVKTRFLKKKAKNCRDFENHDFYPGVKNFCYFRKKTNKKTFEILMKQIFSLESYWHRN